MKIPDCPAAVSSFIIRKHYGPLLKFTPYYIYKGSNSGKEFADGTKSEDLPHDNSTAERPRCKDWEAPLINNDKQEALYRSECR